MYLLDNNKENCCGCLVCADICPKACITFKTDSEGFIYPCIDREVCINCHLCEKVCPVLEGTTEFNDSKDEVLVGTYDADEVIYNSSSGGAFTAIYEEFIKNGYIVYGVMFDGNLKVKHGFAITLGECEKFRKSKYVQSDPDHCYVKIYDQLKNGEKVLFSGTPCQCAALNNYLALKKADTTSLVVIDLLCHGVPCQDLFDRYIAELEEKEGTKVASYQFRNKVPVNDIVNSRTAKISFSNGNVSIINMKKDPFLKGYYHRLFYRPSCGKCVFTKTSRPSDITIGDAWGVSKIYAQFTSTTGTSAIIVNTEKGNAIANNLENRMILKETSLDWLVKNNSVLKKPTVFHKNRNKFFKLLKNCSFEKAVNKTVKTTLIRRVAQKVKKMVNLVLKH